MTASVKETLNTLLIELAGRSEVIVRPDMNAITREVARRSQRAVSDHDVSKVLWSLQKEGRVKLGFTHRGGHSRTGAVTRIEVLR
jgi:hypothetical protein